MFSFNEECQKSRPSLCVNIFHGFDLLFTFCNFTKILPVGIPVTEKFESACSKSMKLSIVLEFLCLFIQHNYFVKGAVSVKNGEHFISNQSVFDLIPVDRGEGVDI